MAPDHQTSRQPARPDRGTGHPPATFHHGDEGDEAAAARAGLDVATWRLARDMAANTFVLTWAECVHAARLLRDIPDPGQHEPTGGGG